MTSKPPRVSAGQFEHIHQVYYGTDDGFAELRPREEPCHDAAHVAGLYQIFARYEAFYRGVAPERRERIHLASVVGGLYGLNLIPLFRPRAITLFDLNPYQVMLFEVIRRVWVDSPSSEAFLERLKNAEYDVASEAEEVIRSCLAERQNGTLTEDRGRSARTLLSSWRYALDHFDLTGRLLAEVPVETRVEGIQSPSFTEFVADSEDLWLFLSNVFLFAFSDLVFQHPRNAAVFACYFDETEMVDLGGYGDGPVILHGRLPMSVEPLRP